MANQARDGDQRDPRLLNPELQREGASKRGVSTHVDGQGTGERTRRSLVKGQPEQGTKRRPGGRPPSTAGR
jgi:hypothetical protein